MVEAIQFIPNKTEHMIISADVEAHPYKNLVNS